MITLSLSRITVVNVRTTYNVLLGFRASDLKKCVSMYNPLCKQWASTVASTTKMHTHAWTANKRQLKDNTPLNQFLKWRNVLKCR